jgi:hypothetical protein
MEILVDSRTLRLQCLVQDIVTAIHWVFESELWFWLISSEMTMQQLVWPPANAAVVRIATSAAFPAEMLSGYTDC